MINSLVINVKEVGKLVEGEDEEEVDEEVDEVDEVDEVFDEGEEDGDVNGGGG